VPSVTRCAMHVFPTMAAKPLHKREESTHVGFVCCHDE
jgi:hypothetical protein